MSFRLAFNWSRCGVCKHASVVSVMLLLLLLLLSQLTVVAISVFTSIDVRSIQYNRK